MTSLYFEFNCMLVNLYNTPWTSHLHFSFEGVKQLKTFIPLTINSVKSPFPSIENSHVSNFYLVLVKKLPMECCWTSSGSSLSQSNIASATHLVFASLVLAFPPPPPGGKVWLCGFLYLKQNKRVKNKTLLNDLKLNYSLKLDYLNQFAL
jgi:hypothetical protein